MPVENFKPIPVVPASRSRVLWAIRCFLDLQLCTIVEHLQPAMAQLRGRVLDIGAGQSPWKEYLPGGCVYQGLDVQDAAEFGMSPRDDIAYYDGTVMPFPAGAFDSAICIEVMEHVPDPDAFLAEVARVLKPGAPLLLSVPWSARRHHVPHDYHRFTREQLAALLVRHGFAHIDIRERGNDVGVIANKLLVLAIRMLRPSTWPRGIWSLPLGVLVAAWAVLMVVAFHVSQRLGADGVEDPLGYFVRAHRANDSAS